MVLAYLTNLNSAVCGVAVNLIIFHIGFNIDYAYGWVIFLKWDMLDSSLFNSSVVHLRLPDTLGMFLWTGMLPPSARI